MAALEGRKPASPPNRPSLHPIHILQGLTAPPHPIPPLRPIHTFSTHRDRLRPAPVAALEGRVVSAVSGGWRHTLAAVADGMLYSWGWNKVGGGVRG